MEKVIKGFKIAGKISEVILAISIIGDLVEPLLSVHGEKLYGTDGSFC